MACTPSCFFSVVAEQYPCHVSLSGVYILWGRLCSQNQHMFPSAFHRILHLDFLASQVSRMWASSYHEWPYLQEFGGIWLNSPRILPTSTHGLSSIPMCQDWSHGGSESYMNLGTLSLVFAFECIWKTWPTVRHKKWQTIDVRQEKITCSSGVESYFRPQNEKLHEEPPGILKKITG